MSDWHRLDIAGLLAAYAGRATDPEAVVGHYLDRIARFDCDLRSFITVDRAGAAASARDSAARWRDGRSRPLEGVPIAVKANLAVVGLEWNAGMGARRGIVADRDADAVASLRAAGAVVLGTLNMHEAALGATTDNPFFGRASNPHDLGRTPGGSSGGSGAAVAAGLCVAALGTDTMGSVRVPAAYNGVYGLKPTRGAISNGGLVPLSAAFDTSGPVARSVGDLATLLLALAPTTGSGRDPSRLLLLDNALLDICEPAVRAGYDRALVALSDMAAEALPLADSPNSVQFAGFIVVARELIGHLAGVPRDGWSNELGFMLDYAGARSDEDVARARDVLARTRESLSLAIGDDGVILTPATPQVAFAHTDRPPANQAAFTAFANVAGLPAVVIPAGVDASGMPVAVQLIGAAGTDRALLRLAARLDARLSAFTPSPILQS